MATAFKSLTVAQFEAQFSQEKPYYEFWYGEAIQKSMPTWIHGLLQRIIMDLLFKAGYKPASEVKLKIDPRFQPVPDVIATRGQIETPYPTRPLEVVIEILSDEDPMSRLLMKCRTYETWGFQEIYVVDPAARVILRWSEHRLEEVNLLAGQPATNIWTALDNELR